MASILFLTLVYIGDTPQVPREDSKRICAILIMYLIFYRSIGRNNDMEFHPPYIKFMVIHKCEQKSSKNSLRL